MACTDCGVLCSNGCSQACTDECTGCRTECTGTCRGSCDGGCRDNCSGGCSGTCWATCGSNCGGTCSGTCLGSATIPDVGPGTDTPNPSTYYQVLETMKSLVKTAQELAGSINDAHSDAITKINASKTDIQNIIDTKISESNTTIIEKIESGEIVPGGGGGEDTPTTGSGNVNVNIENINVNTAPNTYATTGVRYEVKKATMVGLDTAKGFAATDYVFVTTYNMAVITGVEDSNPKQVQMATSMRVGNQPGHWFRSAVSDVTNWGTWMNDDNHMILADTQPTYQSEGGLWLAPVDGSDA